MGTRGLHVMDFSPFERFVNSLSCPVAKDGVVPYAEIAVGGTDKAGDLQEAKAA